MNQNRILSFVLFVTVLFAIAASPTLAASIRYRTAGAYVDSAGATHPWTINDAHTLVWDSEPYIPVGTVFVSKHIGNEPSEVNLQADVSALDALKAKGITDIILKAGKPITDCDAAAVQKIVSYLDENGFTYGFELDDGPREPLSGYLVSPNRYRLDGPRSETTVVCDWPDVDSALYIVVNKLGNNIREQGGAIVRSGKVTIKLKDSLGTSDILIVYPHKTLSGAAGVGDLWAEFGDYRDRMIAFFKNVKFGKGLRFFLEPFTSKMDFSGEMSSFVPDSSGFRLGFEAYLMKKYTHEGSMNSAWGMTERFDNAEVAARLIPLWGSGRGMSYLYDRTSARMYSMDWSQSQVWTDLVDYRDISTQQYMNTISDTLKKNVANVPVIFKCAKYHRLYANPFGMGGCDGLGAQAYGTGEAPVNQVAGGIYSLGEESSKATWLIVADTQATSDASAAYQNEISLTSSLDSFREVGYKGFFIDSVQTSTNSDQLDWLKSFKQKLSTASLPDYKPTVISFPYVPNTGAYVKRLAPNTWWLPTLRLGKTTYIGDGLCGYTIMAENRSYIWSNKGPVTITLKAAQTGLPNVDFPDKGAVSSKKKGVFTVRLTENPVVLSPLDFSSLYPFETTEARIARLAEIIPLADKEHASVTKARSDMENAKSVLASGSAMIAAGIAQASIDDLQAVLGADTWIEGEQPAASSFDGVVATPGASGALALVLDTSNQPALAPYSASYTFKSTDNMSYEIWVAGTPPSEASPATYAIDDASPATLAAMDGKVEAYAPGLAWYKIGVTNAFAGKHVLKITVDGKRQQDNKYCFTIDAIVLSPKGFKPNGIMKP